ncbi:type II secretion system pilot lipoprotein GspS-beta [Thaumasiovibrio subtropicus]|uniref:type II secretion system pilot lipoprotein GspS-beta n=1 Tax=Thaumasiovibrio subtropicus TaxID=1891207 RepID=UPI000B3607BF|nr:type II secretion system pilot lipoprotein GspS-beta [Thaumasiovibrio subtropicus]
MKKLLLSLLCIATIAGCASSPDDEAMAIAQSRANRLNDLMPMDVGKYKFIRARSQEKFVLVEILYGGGSRVTPSQFLRNSIATYCEDPTIRPVLDKGVGYGFTIRDARGRPISEQVITAETCSQ